MRIRHATQVVQNAGRARSRSRRFMARQASRSLSGIAAAMLVVGAAALGQTARLDGNPAIDTTKLSSISKQREITGASPLSIQARPMPVCGSGRRETCIVDGDTFWLDGVKYRIANIDTPELQGKCNAERTAARHARERLKQLMTGKPVALAVTGTDPYGRILALVSGPDGDLGETLVSEGLAEVWGGGFIDWCSG